MGDEFTEVKAEKRWGKMLDCVGTCGAFGALWVLWLLLGKRWVVLEDFGAEK